MLPIYEPYLPKESLKYAHDALDSTWISSQGVYIDKAKDKLKEIFKSKFVVLVNNGTCATHMLALGIQFKYPSIKEIIVPNNVYVAAWNSFLFSGGFNFKVADANLDTWNIDHSKIQSIGRDTALLIVHNLGNIINIPALKKRFPGVVIAEDNCEGLFGTHDGSYSGTQSTLASLSFFGNKTITSGEGGAVFTQDEELFEYLNSIRGQGQSSIRYIHDKLGYNYRMTNVQAALLLGQLEIADEIREKKSIVFETYRKELSQVDEVSLQQIEAGTKHAQWMFAVRFRNFTIQKKQALEHFLFENSIETRPMFYPINKHAHLSHIQSDNKNAEVLNHQVLILPSFPGLTHGQVLSVCRKVKEFLKNNK
ncbi:MAG: DegT/DnrJ/EryC1/StrS aminotransferase family protein [Bacteroidota bacterium]